MKRLCLLLFLGCGCALLGKNDPVVPRYFTPGDGGPAAAIGARAQGHVELRLGRVEGWAHLRERMVVRTSAEELVYAENRQWTERPEVYLRRGLATALFEQRGVVEARMGRALTLDVTLGAFEELEQPHRVRLQALYTLHDDRLGLLQETVTLEQPVRQTKDDEQPRAVAEAFGQVLRGGVAQIADQVVTRLNALSAAR